MDRQRDADGDMDRRRGGGRDVAEDLLGPQQHGKRVHGERQSRRASPATVADTDHHGDGQGCPRQQPADDGVCQSCTGDPGQEQPRQHRLGQHGGDDGPQRHGQVPGRCRRSGGGVGRSGGHASVTVMRPVMPPCRVHSYSYSPASSKVWVKLPSRCEVVADDVVGGAAVPHPGDRVTGGDLEVDGLEVVVDDRVRWTRMGCSRGR